MAACSPVALSGLRNRALMAVMYRAGLRVSEALALRPKDVDAATDAVRVSPRVSRRGDLFGKGGRARTAGLDPGALAVSPCESPWRPAALGRGPSPRGVQSKPTLGRQRPSPDLLHPLRAADDHRLRPPAAPAAGGQGRDREAGPRARAASSPKAGGHTHAAQLRAEGVDIGIISKQLGHRSIATTARYLDHIASVAVVEAIRAREW